MAGFAAGYLAAGSLLAAAGLATLCEAAGFYGCVGVRTAAAASQATAHLAGWRRLAAGTWHAVTDQLASCAAAEALDGFLIRILDRVWLPMPHAGDRVLIGNAGAYTTCYSGRSNFNGYPAPALKITTTAA